MGYQIVTWPMTSRDPQKVLWGSTVGYLIDSLASCYVYWRRRALHAIYATGYILSEYRQTSIHTFQWLLGYDETGNFWKHWNCVAHFRYRGSIEYRDTWGGIVIVAPISGIAQHYDIGLVASVSLQSFEYLLIHLNKTSQHAIRLGAVSVK